MFGDQLLIKPYLTAVTYMLVVNGFGHQRDSQDDDTGDNKQDDGEVEVVDSTDDGGTVTGVNAAACPKGKLSNHPGQADKKADCEAVECTLRKEAGHPLSRLHVLGKGLLKWCYMLILAC